MTHEDHEATSGGAKDGIARRRPRWSQLVKDGKRLLATENATKWAWGDLSLLVEPSGAVGPRTGSEERLGKWAAAIGWDRPLGTLLQYRYVAKAWPPETRRTAAFSAHHALAGHPDRFDLIYDKMTVGEARALVGAAPARRPYRIRTERLISALRDPETVALVLRDVEVRRALQDALAESIAYAGSGTTVAGRLGWLTGLGLSRTRVASAS